MSFALILRLACSPTSFLPVAALPPRRSSRWSTSPAAPAGRLARNDDGDLGGDAADQAVRHDRRHRLDLDHELAGLDLDRHPVRAEPRYRRGGGRRAGGDRPRAEAAAARDDRARRATARSTRPTRRSSCWRWSATVMPLTASRRLRPAGDLAGAARPSTAWRRCQIFGSQKYAVRIQIDPTALAARGIGVDELQSGDRLGQQPTRRSARCRTTAQQLTIEAPIRSSVNAAHFANLIIATRNGQPVRLGDVTQGDRLGREQPTTASRYNGTPAIVLGACSASRTPTPSTWSTGSRRCCRPSTTSCRRGGQRSTCSTTARRSIRARGRRRAVHAGADHRAGRRW